MFGYIVFKLGILQNLNIYEYDFYENNNELIKAVLEYKDLNVKKNIKFYFNLYEESVPNRIF